MGKRTIILGAALLCSFGLFCAANVTTAGGLHPRKGSGPVAAGPRADEPDCKDKMAVALAIYAHLKKNGFTKQQVDRINVSFNPDTRVVTLQGFVTPPSRRSSEALVGVNRAGKLAAEATSCESSVDNKLTPIRKHGCTPPRVPCGQTGVCLPPDECTAGKSR